MDIMDEMDTLAEQRWRYRVSVWLQVAASARMPDSGRGVRGIPPVVCPDIDLELSAQS